ncbi:MAG TPA: hypothetical protein VGO34_00665 [Alphaproteobacteria bacterium]|jgi:hypothetical protein
MKVSAPLLHAAVTAFLAAALAGCASNSGDSGSIVPWQAPTALGPAAEAGPSVHWRTSLDGNVVVVEVQDRNNAYRVERVDLLAPDGRIFPSKDITRDRLTPGGRWNAGGVGVGVGGYGGGRDGTNVGVMLGIPLGGGAAADPVGTEARTTARIPLADVASYRATSASWKVKVSFSDNGGYNSSALFPAPTP